MLPTTSHRTALPTPAPSPPPQVLPFLSEEDGGGTQAAMAGAHSLSAPDRPAANWASELSGTGAAKRPGRRDRAGAPLPHLTPAPLRPQGRRGRAGRRCLRSPSSLGGGGQGEVGGRHAPRAIHPAPWCAGSPRRRRPRCRFGPWERKHRGHQETDRGQPPQRPQEHRPEERRRQGGVVGQCAPPRPQRRPRGGAGRTRMATPTRG